MQYGLDSNRYIYRYKMSFLLWYDCSLQTTRLLIWYWSLGQCKLALLVFTGFVCFFLCFFVPPSWKCSWMFMKVHEIHVWWKNALIVHERLLLDWIGNQPYMVVMQRVGWFPRKSIIGLSWNFMHFHENDWCSWIKLFMKNVSF